MHIMLKDFISVSNANIKIRKEIQIQNLKYLK
jgi:hypothetical protein